MKAKKSRKAILPPPTGQADWWVTLHVKFVPPIPNDEDPAATPLQGYYCNLGVRAAPNCVQLVISAAVTDGVIDWSRTEWDLTEPNDLEDAIRTRVIPVVAEGVWYRSGRAVYADPDLEPPPSPI